MSRPIFILSLPRAGSTLLQRMLLASGRCATLGEPGLLLRFLGEGDLLSRRATYGEWLLETAREDMRAAWSGFDEAYRDGVRRLVEGLYDGLADGREWFVDKTPRYSLIAEEVFRTFPEAKFIVLWRHPLAIADSISRTFCEGGWWMEEFGIDLYAGMERLQRFAERHAEGICQLRYEDLVTDPGAEMARVGEHLGIDGLGEVAGKQLVESAGGRLGDPTGTKQFSEVSAASRDAWEGRIDNWMRRGWCRRYFDGERAEWLESLGYTLPEGIARGGWWRGDPVGGLRDWWVARKRLRRRMRRPKWQRKFAAKFRREHGFDVGFH